MVISDVYFDVAVMNEWMNEMFILLSYEGYFYEWEHDRTVNGNVKVKVVDCIEIRWVIQYYSRTLEKHVLQWLFDV